MRILILHNSYQFLGGEDEAVAGDVRILQAHGHQTELYTRGHGEIVNRDGVGNVALAAESFWSPRSYLAIRGLIRRQRPDIAHFHNIFPLITPSGYAACRAEGVPVVQTLHNYRLICPAATLLRDNQVCELCVGRVPWPAVRYRCYRGSREQSAVMASVIGAHALLGTWRAQVDAYVVPTEFAKKTFAKGQLPEQSIFVRPNAVDVAVPVEYGGPHSAVFVGRLSPEKGVRTLLEAWCQLPDLPLTLIGDGPLNAESRSFVRAHGLQNVEFTGQLEHSVALERIRRSGMLIFPSISYETFGLAAVEALASGIPVVASDIGVAAEVVSNGVNGLHFRSGDALSLAIAVKTLVSSPPLAKRLGAAARLSYLERYSVEQSYGRLMDVYQSATRTAHSS